MKDIMLIDENGGALAIATAATLAGNGFSVRSRATTPPTPAQLAKQAADRERAEWNRAVEAKKAEKKARKG